jgi:hypothetical protein
MMISPFTSTFLKSNVDEAVRTVRTNASDVRIAQGPKPSRTIGKITVNRLTTSRFQRRTTRVFVSQTREYTSGRLRIMDALISRRDTFKLLDPNERKRCCRRKNHVKNVSPRLMTAISSFRTRDKKTNGPHNGIPLCSVIVSRAVGSIIRNKWRPGGSALTLSSARTAAKNSFGDISTGVFPFA